MDDQNIEIYAVSRHWPRLKRELKQYLYIYSLLELIEVHICAVQIFLTNNVACGYKSIDQTDSHILWKLQNIYKIDRAISSKHHILVRRWGLLLYICTYVHYMNGYRNSPKLHKRIEG